MKNLFKLLTRNAIRIFWKSKWLFIQFMLLLFLALTVFCSIFLSNTTLSQSLNNVIENGHMAYASVENLANKDDINYQFKVNKSPGLNTPDRGSTTIFNVDKPNDISWNDIVEIKNVRVYNPVIESKYQLGDGNNPNDNVTLYGYYKTTDNINQANPSLWPNLVYGLNNDFCLNVNTILTDPQYKPDLVNVYSFYKDILQPKIDITQKSNMIFSPLYNLSNYAFNPFKLYIVDNQIKNSNLNNSYIDQYEKNDSVELVGGVLSKKYGAIINYDNSLLPNYPNNPTNSDLLSYFKNITITEPPILGNNQNITFAINPEILKSFDSWSNYMNKTYPAYQIFNMFSQSLYNVQSQFYNEFKKRWFTTPVGFLKYDYVFDPTKSNGITAFLFDKLKSKAITPEQATALGYKPEDKKFFSSTINIPLIPYINLTRNKKLEAADVAILKTELFDHPNLIKQNWLIDKTKVANQIGEAAGDLANQLAGIDAKILTNMSNSTDPEIIKIYNEYLSIYDLQYQFEKDNINYCESKTTNITYNNKNYILSQVSNNEINQFVSTEGTMLNLNQNKVFANFENDFWIWRDLIGSYDPHYDFGIPNGYNDYIKYPDIISLFKIISESTFDNVENTVELYKLASYLGDKNNLTNESQWPSYREKLEQFANLYYVGFLQDTGSGYKFKISTRVGGINDMWMPIVGIYQYTSSKVIALSNSYSEVTNGTYSAVDTTFLENALKLPSYVSEVMKDTIINDPLNGDHYIYNPYSKKVEFYLSYDDWVDRLPDKYKMVISGESFVISGIGTTPEYLYPILNSNQILLDKNIPVIFTNPLSLSLLTTSQSCEISSYFWLDFPPDWNYFNKKDFLNTINEFSLNLFNKNVAYAINDSSQPNKLLYLRMNFPNQVLLIINIVTAVIGVIIGLLALFFICALLRSIIKQNMNTISILLSNGISKHMFALSTFSYILIPSFISSLIAYIAAFFIFPLINNAVADYWALDIANIWMTFLPFLVMFGISFFFLYFVLYLTLLWTLRKPVAVLLGSNVEFKMNKLIIWTKPLASKFGALGSFRISFMLGNMGRFFLLTLLMTSFATLFNIFTGTINMFQNSLQYTIANNSSVDGKTETKYNMDFITPTPASGYYFNIPLNEMGEYKAGYTQNFDLNSNQPEDPYNSKYKPMFTFTNPKTETQKVYSQLGFVDVSLVREISYNNKFFNNKVWSRLFLDFEFNFLGFAVNPWGLAKGCISSDTASIADIKFNNQINDAFEYFLYLNDPNKFDLNNPKLHYKNPHPKPGPNGYSYNPFEEIDPNFKYYWYVNSNDIINHSVPTPNLIDDLNNSPNPEDWNQTNWYYQCKKQPNGSYMWKLNSPFVTTGLPNVLLRPELVKLIIGIISLYENPDYVIYKNNLHLPLDNLNTFFSTNAVPVDPTTDKMYTYIDGNINAINDESTIDINVNIKGINPEDTDVINLWYDEHTHNYMDDLLYYENSRSRYVPQAENPNIFDIEPVPYKDGTYPLVINKVVAKKYGYKINDIISVHPNNLYKRYEYKNNNTPIKNTNFKIIGITESTSEEQFFTTQTVANHILGLKKPIYKPSTSIEVTTGNFPNYWTNLEAAQNYIPFNGLMTKNPNPDFLENSITLMTESGLSPIDGAIDATNGSVVGSIKYSWNELNSILRYDFINPDLLYQQPLIPTMKEFATKFVNFYGTNQMFKLNLKDINSNAQIRFLGSTIDNTISDLITIIIIAFIPTLLIVLLLLSYIIIIEARRLIALLKVLGFNNWVNTISLIFSYFVSICLSMLLSVAFTYGILYGMSELFFNFINIITSPVAPYWSYFANLGILLGLVFFLALITYGKLKQTKPTEVVSIR